MRRWSEGCAPSRTRSTRTLRREIADVYHHVIAMTALVHSLRVIASAAKQSISPRKERMDCFVARAPLRKRHAFVAGNDDGHNLNFRFSEIILDGGVEAVLL